MRLRKFTASHMRDAVAKVKAELGPDAMIVATQQTRAGFEVTAAIDDDEPVLDPRMLERAAPGPAPAPVSPPQPAAHLESAIAPLYSEIRSLRSQMPQQDAMKRELSAIRELLQKTHHESLGIRNAVHRDALQQISEESCLAATVERSRIALVGPTGVGKTTTIAKLAARSALIDRESVAIVTVDTYRVGGEQQIRIFADLIGVPLMVVDKLEDLGRETRRLADFDRVFIDTAGRSPRDKNAWSELVHALADVPDCETHLAMSANATAAQNDQLLQRLGPMNIDRLLYTKLDEAETLRELVEGPARLDRPVCFLTTGQRVPEDLEVATSQRLLQLATSGFELDEVAA